MIYIYIYVGSFEVVCDVDSDIILMLPNLA